jgi:hypothetical protein
MRLGVGAKNAANGKGIGMLAVVLKVLSQPAI